MTKKKNNKFLSVFSIFFKNIKVYFMYLDKTAKYMLIPVLGQVIGFALILIATYYFNVNIDNIRQMPFFAKSEGNLLLALFICISPFLALFLHSLYRYIIAFSALNIVFYTISPKKTVKDIDFKANDRVIERKLFQYVLLMFFVSILCLFPPMWICLCLAFQVFALESGTNCLKSISRSFQMAIGNLFSVITMLVLVYILTYWFLPTLFVWALEKISVVDFLVTKSEVYLQLLPFDNWNSILALFNQHIDSVTIAKVFIECGLMFIITGFTLPFRCACFTDLYRIFDNEKIKEFSKEDDEIIRRATSKKRKKS